MRRPGMVSHSESSLNAISRMSPPQLGHLNGNSSPTRAMSLAHAIREVSCERGFNAGDAAISTADHRELFQRERRRRTGSQQMLKALKVARHVAVDERDPDAGVHRETTVFPAEHGGRRIGVEKPGQRKPTGRKAADTSRWTRPLAEGS